MATHSSTLAWRIPWTEEPNKLQSMGSQRVGQDFATNFHFTSFLRKTISHHSNPSLYQTHLCQKAEFDHFYKDLKHLLKRFPFHYSYFIIGVVVQLICHAPLFQSQWLQHSMLHFLHYLLEFAQSHVHWVSDAIKPSIICHPLPLWSSIFPSIRVFSNESALPRWPKYWTLTS